MKKYNDIENMMINIVDFGENEIYQEIENEIDAIKRFNQRDIFFKALDKINDNN